jgi:hypothetical protein
MKGCLIAIGIILAIAFFSWVVDNWRKARRYKELKPRLDNVEATEFDLKNKQAAWERKVQNDVEATEFDLKNKQAAWERKVQNDLEAINTLAKEKSQGFPWLAKAYANYFYLQKLGEAAYLEHKSHPARVSAERVRNIACERRTIEEKLRIAQGIINYYQDLFPFLEELLGEPDEEIIKQILSQNIEEPIREVGEVGIDPVRVYLTSLSKEEYQKLSPSERNQLALERYWSRPKTNWQLGRDYERYIGYMYEADGYNVYYQGILEGLDDLGRGLICKKGKQTIVIQCKRWSQHKTIHEKHVNQLYGTFVKYSMDRPDEIVSARLCTTTKLSDRAKEFDVYLGVSIAEEFPLQRYPSIKCNVSRRNGEKIYHLPFDQQYDRTLIKEERNECYVETVQEAENLGYRRAWRWQGQEPE